MQFKAINKGYKFGILTVCLLGNVWRENRQGYVTSEGMAMEAGWSLVFYYIIFKLYILLSLVNAT